MRRLLLLLSFAIAAPAQDPQPRYWIGAGAAYDRSAAGWISAAAKIADSTYSITTVELTPPSSRVRTGLARLLAQSGNFTLLAHTDAGIAAGSGPALGSFSGGGMLLYDLAGISPRLSRCHLVAVVRVLAVNSALVRPVFEFGFGKAF